MGERTDRSEAIAKNTHPEIIKTYARQLPEEPKNLSNMHVDQDGVYYEVCPALFEKPYQDFTIPIKIEIRHIGSRTRAVLRSIGKEDLN